MSSRQTPRLPPPNLATTWPGTPTPAARPRRGHEFAPRNAGEDTEPFSQDTNPETAIRTELKLKGVR